jgi:hypothetical protein
MRLIFCMLIIVALSITACRHSSNTPPPNPMVDPLAYVDSMAGNHHWHGILYSYTGIPMLDPPTDSSMISVDDTLIVVSNKKLFCFNDSLYYSSSNTAAHTITFTMYDSPTGTYHSTDTLVYNYSSKTYLFKAYEVFQHGNLKVLQSP